MENIEIKLISTKDILTIIPLLNKKKFETNYPRGRAIAVFRWFHFDLKKVKNQNSVFRFPFYSLFYIL